MNGVDEILADIRANVQTTWSIADGLEKGTPQRDGLVATALGAELLLTVVGGLRAADANLKDVLDHAVLAAGTAMLQALSAAHAAQVSS